MWEADLLSILNKKNKENSILMFATVLNVDPISIEINNQKISKYIYIDPTLIYTAGDLTDDPDGNVPQRITQYLRAFRDAHQLHVGDLIVVLKSDVSFYVLSRVA